MSFRGLQKILIKDSKIATCGVLWQLVMQWGEGNNKGNDHHQ
jgi:hypothetical protein